MSQCPACEREHPEEARFCSLCGTPLVKRCRACNAINVRSRVRCHHCAAVLDPGLAPQSLETDDLQVPESVLPVLDEIDDPALEGWTLSLRSDPLPAASTPAAAAFPAPAGGGETPLAVDAGPAAGVVLSDPASWAPPDPPPALPPALPPTLPPTSAPLTPPATPPTDAEALAARKARRRATVRRAQMRRQAVLGDIPAARDVLVLEADPHARTKLCQTLLEFGFEPHVAVSAAEAEGLSLRQPHVAAFLGLGSDCDAADTEALCRRLHDAPRGRPLALIAIGDRRRHADRIRMQLAGADQMLFRPVARGDIARALADCGLRLPDDPRLGTKR